MSTKAQTSLEELYRTNNNQLEKNKQKQLEEAYVNQELMNKYLDKNMNDAGLGGSGIAELYKMQANTDYMNNRAAINSDFQSKQQELSNQYYTAKKDEEDAATAKLEEEKRLAQEKLEKEQKDMFQMYVNKVDNSLNQYGYLDDYVKSQLSEYFNRESIGEHYSSILDEYMNSYTATDEQKAYIKEQEDITKYSPYYEQYANQFLEETYNNLLSNNKLSSEQVQNYLKELEEIKHKIGDFYYEEIKRALLEFEETEDERKRREAFEKVWDSISPKEDTNEDSGGGGGGMFGGRR